MRGSNQIITPLPNIRGIDANIPKNAPLELIKLIVKINKTDKTKTIMKFNLLSSFICIQPYIIYLIVLPI